MKKIARISLLLILRESYLLIKNLLGLIYHPFLTLREIRAKKDLSQATLISALIAAPFFLAVILSLFYLIIKYLFRLNVPSLVVLVLKFIDLTATVFLFSTVFYLAFWSYQVIKKNHTRFWEEI